MGWRSYSRAGTHLLLAWSRQNPVGPVTNAERAKLVRAKSAYLLHDQVAEFGNQLAVARIESFDYLRLEDAGFDVFHPAR